MVKLSLLTLDSGPSGDERFEDVSAFALADALTHAAVLFGGRSLLRAMVCLLLPKIHPSSAYGPASVIVKSGIGASQFLSGKAAIIRFCVCESPLGDDHLLVMDPAK